MKRFFCLFLTGIVIVFLTACSVDDNKTDKAETNYMTTLCSKDSVGEFLSLVNDVELGGLMSGYTLDEKHCYNVTPLSVATETNIKIFKFSDSCISFALIDGEVFPICEYFGGFGFVNAVPWDYDKDGHLDLLIASSWGSGMHRSQISVFDTRTKESILIYDTSTTDNPSVDLFVGRASPSFSSKDSNVLPIYYQVYSANIRVENSNHADLLYTATGVVGSVTIEDGVPMFKPIEE